MKRTAMLAPTLSACALVASPCLSQEPTPPERQESRVSFQERTKDMTPEERARADEERNKKVEEFDAAEKIYYQQTATAWAQSLKAISENGWTPIEIDPAGTVAIFATRRQLVRDGSHVFAWFRWENRIPVKWKPNANAYSSTVEELEFDCKRKVSMHVTRSPYIENGPVHGFTNNEDLSSESLKYWSPLFPHSIGLAQLTWACTNAPPPSASWITR